jgi:hypothetical protein
VFVDEIKANSSHGPFHLGQSSAHHADRLLHLRCLHLGPRRDRVRAVCVWFVRW